MLIQSELFFIIAHRKKKEKGTSYILKPLEMSDRCFIIFLEISGETQELFFIYGCSSPSKREPGAASFRNSPKKKHELFVFLEDYYHQTIIYF